MTDLSDEAVKILIRQVDRQVRDAYGRHRQIEDILAAAHLGAWSSILRAAETGACAPSTAAVRGGLHAAANWLRSAENDERKVTRRGLKLPVLSSLEDMGQPPAHLDFAPALLARLETKRQVEAWIADGVLTWEEWEMIKRTVIDGELAVDCAHALGMAYWAFVERRRAALARLARASETSEGDS